MDQAFRTLLFVPQKILLLPTIRHFDFRNFLGNRSEVYECWPFKNCKIPRCGSWAGYNGLYGEAPPEWSSLRSWRYCVGARLKFWWRSRVPKKGSRSEAVFLAASPHVTAPPSNFTRLYYNGSVAKSHSTTTQCRQLRRLEWSTVVRRQINERVGISLVEVSETVGG